MLLGTFGWGFSVGNIYNAKHKDTYAFTNILGCFGKIGKHITWETTVYVLCSEAKGKLKFKHPSLT